MTKPAASEHNSSSASLSVVPPVADAPLLFLEIHRGRTRFPRRPVPLRRFLIGKRDDCDLQLRDRTIPPVHSVIEPEGNTARIRAVAEQPPLTINGRSRQSARLAEGDRIAIGFFECLASYPEVDKLTNADKNTTDNHAGFPANSESNLGDLSAAELTEMIEKDMALIDEMEAEQPAGMQALMAAVRERADALQEESASQPENADAPQELEQMVHKLNAVSHEIEACMRRMSDREATVMEAAQQVMDVQQTLSGQLDALIGHLESQPIDEGPRPKRSVA